MPDGKDKDFTVIGAGIVGICAALALQEKGCAGWQRLMWSPPPRRGEKKEEASKI